MQKRGSMFHILSEHMILTGLIIAFLFLSIICQTISAVIYQNMIIQADNMSATENKLLKQCKQKYASYYKLNGKMINTSVFVDKFLQRIKIAGIYLSRLSHISGQLMMLSILIAGISICYLLAAGNTLFQIIPYYLISILGLYLYFSVSGMLDVQEKKNILKTNLMDYLENHYAPRLEIEKENALEEGIRKREVYAKELLQDEPDEQNEEKTDHAYLEEPQKAVPKGTDTEGLAELENLLEEFFA